MKITCAIPLLAVLTGCASQGTNVTPSPDASMTSQQDIQKLQNDPKVPDGLKQIQIDTLKHQPGTKP